MKSYFTKGQKSIIQGQCRTRNCGKNPKENRELYKNFNTGKCYRKWTKQSYTLPIPRSLIPLFVVMRSDIPETHNEELEKKFVIVN